MFIDRLRLRENGRHFADDSYKCILLNENFKISYEISLKYVPYGIIDNLATLVQVIIWINVGMFYWGIYESVGLNELILITSMGKRKKDVNPVH